MFDELNAVYDAVDRAAFEEQFEFVKDWDIAVVVTDSRTPSGTNYQWLTVTAPTKKEAEQKAKKRYGDEIDSSKTEFDRYGRVA